MHLTSEAVRNIFEYVLFKDNEEFMGTIKPEAKITDAVFIDGITNKFGFNQNRLKEKEQEIIALLAELPDSFHEGKGGGMSFLSACYDKNNTQWGEHSNMEQLFVLGMAIGKVKECMPRDMWKLLPGGMPYYTILK